MGSGYLDCKTTLPITHYQIPTTKKSSVMDSEELDDLFRAGLGQHPTPPPADLWARLQARPETDAPTAPAPDALFQARLAAHATPPGRHLWERLEDEHLRPRKRRAAAWWPMALAASLLLLVLAGGALLWRNAGRRGTEVAGQFARPSAGSPDGAAGSPDDVPDSPDVMPDSPDVVPGTRHALAGTPGATGGQPKRAAGRATQPTRHASEPASTRNAALPPAAWATAPAKATPDAAQVAPLLPVPTSATPAPDLASLATAIEVDVRPGGSPKPAVDAPPASAPTGRHLLTGLLKQASHLARGERLTLAQDAGLPDSLFLQARLAGHTLTRIIQL